ncbi:MAG: efflux RND transporter periplasmic adaptor subunit [candidate division Zixibacteria bacterium]|nr:efflux RND transporter periplasmic adaptor subunit [candidate division Zixibacteria bacterium]
MRKHRLAFLALLLLLASIAGCSSSRSAEEGNSSISPIVAVKVAEIKSADIPVTLTALGKTNALREEKIFSPITGKILSLKAIENVTVHKGDVITMIRTKESQAAIDGAEVLIRSASTVQQRSAAERALLLADSTQTVVIVRASSEGIVSLRNVSEGELVNEGAELVSIVDLWTLEFIAETPVHELAKLHTGQGAMVTLTALPNVELMSTVYAINSQTDPESQTATVHLRFANLPQQTSSLLRTGMVGSVQITIATRRNALLVPRTALLRNDETDSYSLVTISADSLAKAIAVTVGIMTDSLAEVSAEGLAAGMSVIVEGHYALEDSTRVTVTSSQRQ